MSGRLPKPMNARIRLRPPAMPATIVGWTSSSTSPASPITNRTNAMFGSVSRWRNAITGFIGASLTAAPARSRVTVPALVVTCRPCAAASTASSEAAIPSTAWAATACSAEADVASRTVDTAQSTLRPRVSAIEVMVEIAMLRILSPSVPGMSPPEESTGDAAPMLVPGAM